ncbi:MAG TPA: response regulator [Panacibacter sp.]|nr:response regulator [Panacibacter sp.]
MKINTVCIIDDDRIYQLTSIKILERINVANNILVFSDGEKAYNFLSEMVSNENALPDVIFLDVNMPFMDAWQFLDAFTALKPKLAKDITIYVISSSISEMDVERAKSIEAVKDYFVKPITLDQYAKMLTSV